jgi:hypothetical protein
MVPHSTAMLMIQYCMYLLKLLKRQYVFSRDVYEGLRGGIRQIGS